MRGSKTHGEQDQGTRLRVELGTHLTLRRKDIDRKYEFRLSRLTQVLAILLCEGRIVEEELRGLRDDKVKAIRSCAKVLSEDAA